jgi:hypothetical protein
MYVLLREDAFWVCSKLCRQITREVLAGRVATGMNQPRTIAPRQGELEATMCQQISMEVSAQLEEKLGCIATIAEAVTGMEKQLSDLKQGQEIRS